MKCAESIVNNYSVNETIKNRLAEGREILSEHISNISRTLNDLLGSFKKEVNIDVELEGITKRILNKNLINYSDVFCYVDKMVEVKLE